MHSTYIGQLPRAAAAPLILRMRINIEVWLMPNTIRTLHYDNLDLFHQSGICVEM